MPRTTPLPLISALKLAGALALSLLVGACQYLPSSLYSAKPETPPAPPPVAQQAPVPAPTPTPAPQPAPALQPVVRGGSAALLLPLTGPQAGLGMALFNAAQLALFELGDDSFALMPFDTHGTADGATQAVQQALARHPDIVIGPLFSAEAAATGPSVRQAGIPMIAFTTDRTVAGDGVYTLGFLPGAQAVRVALEAKASGLNRLAVLAPSNDYGRRLVEHLSNSLPPDGPTLTASEFYDPTVLDWSGAIRRLVKTDPKKGGDLGFDALLLPDEGARLRNVAAALAAQGVDPARVKFLGTQLWQDARAGTEPALVGGWYAAPPAAGHADFEQRYQRAFNAKPPKLAALSYDAAALAVVLAKRDPHNYSAQILTNPTGFVGIDGIFRLQADGIAERGYAVYEVQANGPDREVAPAPAAFQPAY